MEGYALGNVLKLMHQASAMMSARDATIPEVPSAPSGLGATTVDDTKVDLNWTDNSSGAEQENDFEIQYDTDSGFGSPSSTTAAQDAITKRITGLSSGTQYHFRIRARNDAGNSAWSASASATTDSEPSSPPDGAPSSLSASTNDESRIDLSWTDNATNEDEQEIQYDTDAGFGSPSTKIVAANATSTTITGLSEGTEYHFRIRASNTDGDSAWSNTDSAFTQLNPPTGLQATDNGSFWRLTWDDNSALEQNYEILEGASSSFDVIPANSEQYDIDEATAENQSWFVRAIHSSIPDSDTASVLIPAG